MLRGSMLRESGGLRCADQNDLKLNCSETPLHPARTKLEGLQIPSSGRVTGYSEVTYSSTSPPLTRMMLSCAFRRFANNLNRVGPGLQPATKGARAGSRAIANPALAIRNIARMRHPQRGKLSEDKCKSKIKRVGHRSFAYNCTLFAQNWSQRGEQWKPDRSQPRKAGENSVSRLLGRIPFIPHTPRHFRPNPLKARMLHQENRF